MVSTESRSIYDELDQLNEAELESVIANEPAKADDARYTLGKLLIAGMNTLLLASLTMVDDGF